MNPALTITGVSKVFGRFVALNNVSLSVEPCERRAIIGPNGAGKSTLFNIIAGQLVPTAGQIFLNGAPATRARADTMWHNGVTRTFQRNQLFQGLRVWENIELAYAARRQDLSSLLSTRRGGDVEATIGEVLKKVHLAAHAERFVRELAYGEQRQLELALALAGAPKVLLLDEPTAGMSPMETKSMLALMQNLPRDITLLIVEHDMDVVFNLADKITVLHLGEVLADGRADDIRSNDKVREIYMGRRNTP